MNPHAARALREYGPSEVMDRSQHLSHARSRPPAVAGLFYPASAPALQSDVSELLSAAAKAPQPSASGQEGATSPKALIVPHAGYRYSGRVAAAGFVELANAPSGHADVENRIVFLLGPPHRVYVRGLALPAARVFQTPLGEVRLHEEICTELLGSGFVQESAEAHAQEHSLEVELPFLQMLGGENLSIVPLLVGDAEPRIVADLLERYYDDPRVYYVVSSDLSHFLDDESARQRDSETLRKILDLSQQELTGDEACGCRAVNGLLELVRRKGLHPSLLGAETSFDHGGPKDRVVGYGAVGFWSGEMK